MAKRKEYGVFSPRRSYHQGPMTRAEARKLARHLVETCSSDQHDGVYVTQFIEHYKADVKISVTKVPT